MDLVIRSILKMKYIPALMCATLIASGCAGTTSNKPVWSDEEQKQTTSNESQENKPNVSDESFQVLEKAQWVEAYRKGVRDSVEDLKGKMRAREQFVYEPNLVECGVKMPAQVINGALIPSHKSCVVVSPGRWEEESYTAIPVMGGTNHD